MIEARNKPPRRLGRYEVGAKIAGGGMATIYAGRVASGEGVDEGRAVALKVIKDEHVENDTYVHMFLDEAKILSQLSHPNVIDTLEFGVTDDHRFIAMELLLGRSLSDVWEQRIKDGAAFPYDLAAWIGARVADGLHYAHELRDEKGEHLHVIHRDVNPTNIFLTYDGRVKLIDFGLAKSVGRMSKSVDGIVKGKIPYLAPEQVRESSIDRRADVYTLGITLWELTTARRLFKRSTDVATLRAIQKAEVPDPTELAPDYPPEMWRIVKRSLEQDRELRYATAADVAKDLDAFLVTVDATDASGIIGRTAMQDRLAKFLAETYPGEQDRQLAWLEEATEGERAAANMTMRPPVPVGQVPVSLVPPVPPPAEAPSDSAPPSERMEVESVQIEASTSAASVPPNLPSAATAPKKKKKKKSRSNLKAAAAPASRPSVPPVSPIVERAPKPARTKPRRDPQPVVAAANRSSRRPGLPPGAAFVLSVLATAILLYTLASR